MMTVAELIVELQKYPSDMFVVASGYESGYDSIRTVEIRHVFLNKGKGTGWYHGEHSFSTGGKTSRTTDVLLIQGRH